MRYVLALSMFVFSHVSLAQMPDGGHFPPCGKYEVLDKVCTQYLTAPDGSQLCAPGGMRDICVPAIDVPEETSDGNVYKCQQDARYCVDNEPFKYFNGQKVPIKMAGGCWEYKRDYTCSTSNTENTCQEYDDDPSCEAYSRQCISQAGVFGCAQWKVTYKCLTKPGKTEQVEYCGDRDICVGGVCWDTGYPPDEDFAQVISDMEAGRQIGVYNTDGLDIFHGTAGYCRSKRGAGLKNCCSTSGGAKSNNGVMGEAISGAAGFAARAGSKYVFDTLYGDTVNWVSSGWASAVSGNLPGGQGLLDSISSPGFGMYGFSIGGTGSFLGTAGTAIGSVGPYPVYFNPYALAFSLAVQVIMSAMSCDQDEAMLAMKRDAGLCTDTIDDWCTKEILGVCITRRRSYCCYNSKIAKIINVQGRAQLGMGWGDTHSPSCNGFTVDQLKAIDFSKIDFSEFIGDVMAAVDTSHLKEDLLKMQGGSAGDDLKSSTLQASCQRTFDALGGDLKKMPSECAGFYQ